MSATDPIRRNRPTHATISAPTTAPPAWNAIIHVYCATPR